MNIIAAQVDSPLYQEEQAEVAAEHLMAPIFANYRQILFSNSYWISLYFGILILLNLVIVRVSRVGSLSRTPLIAS